LSASVALQLDEALLDASAGDATRPPGLRYNIAALTAASGTDRDVAMGADLAALINAISPVSGAEPFSFVGDVSLSSKIKMRAAGFPFPIFTTSASSMAGKLMIVASSVLVSVLGSIRIEANKDATLHLADPASPIATTSAIVSPVGSVWQTGNVSVRVILEAAWALRSSVGVAWLTPTAW
jgi:hypothetical protein